MPGTNKVVELTQLEAEGVLDNLKYERRDMRNPVTLNSRERLAIGLVALKMWVTEGKTQRAVAEELKMPQSTLSRYINTALDSVALPTVTQARIQMLEDIDARITPWLSKSDAGDEKAASVVAKFMEMRAKVTGAFAPIVIDQTVTEVSLAERELAAMVSEQEAENRVLEVDGADVDA